MAEMTPAMTAAITADRPLLFGAIEINMPGYDLRLVDGSAELKIDGNKFVGRDPVYGTISSVDALSDGTGDEAPAISLSLLPPGSSAAAGLASAPMQGSRVRFWLGVLDMWTGIVVPDPLLLFDGVLDVATMKWGMNTREVEYRVASVFERFFELEEGIRLCDSWHQSIWPGEKGLEFVTGVAETVPWGTDNIGSIVKK